MTMRKSPPRNRIDFRAARAGASDIGLGFQNVRGGEGRLELRKPVEAAGSLEIGNKPARQEMARLRERVATLERDRERVREKVTTLESEVEALKASQQGPEIELRNLPREQAKAEIKALYSTGLTLYMSEVAERLRLPSPLVVDICTELRGEGELVRGNVS